MGKTDIYIKHKLEKYKSNLPKFLAETFLADHSVQLMLFFTLVLVLSSWIVAFLRFQPSEFQVPLRYDSFLGVTRLGRWYELYRLPLIATAVLIFNIFLGNLTYKKDKMLGYILVGTTIFVAILALIVTINFGILLK